MKRGSVFILFLAAMLFVAVPVALAYTAVEGQVNDAYGNPWTHGGTVICIQNATGITVGTSTIAPDGSWYVYVGSPPALTCAIDPVPALGGGDPPPYTCDVPRDNGGGVQVYSCGPGSTGTGPNAVSLVHFSGTSLPVGAGVLTLVSSLAVSAFLWLRRR